MNARTGAAALALLALLGACGDEDDPAAGAGSTSTAPLATLPGVPTTADGDLAAALDGREFLSAAVEGETLVEGTQIRLSFDGGQLGVAPGCNSAGSTFAVEGDQLVVESMAITEMACEPAALMDQDTWVVALLSARPTLSLDASTLTVSGPAVSITFTDREVADPDRPLEGTAWTLESIISADAVSSVPTTMRTPTLSIADGRLDVDTGCNTGSADVTVADGEMTIGPLVLTRTACADPTAQDVEDHIVAVLTDAATVDIDAAGLTIAHGDLGLGYRAGD